MKKSSEHSREIEIQKALAAFKPQPPDLEFPVDPDFISKPPRLPWQHVYHGSLERLDFRMNQPGFEEKRLARKSFEEFIL